MSQQLCGAELPARLKQNMFDNHTLITQITLVKVISPVFRERQSVTNLVCFKHHTPGETLLPSGGVSPEALGDTSREHNGTEQAMSWSGAVLLSWAGLLGAGVARGKRAELQRELCPGAAPLHSAAGLGALTTGDTGSREQERGTGGSEESHRGQRVAGHTCRLFTS